MHKPIRKLLAPMLVLFLIATGCNFISGAKTKLAHYCPGLKVGISGIHYSNNNGTKTYTINYDEASQKAVDAYFTNKENGFTQSDGKSRDSNGFIWSKAFLGSTTNAEVVYSKLTQQIIITENAN